MDDNSLVIGSSAFRVPFFDHKLILCFPSLLQSPAEQQHHWPNPSRDWQANKTQDA